MRVTGVDGRPFNVILVREFERYGLNKGKIHDSPEPLVEFYDAKYENDPRFDDLGQFVSRYDADVILGESQWSRGSSAESGLCLDGGNARTWTIPADQMKLVCEWVKARRADDREYQQHPVWKRTPTGNGQL